MNSTILLGLEILGGIVLLAVLVFALSKAFKYDLFYDSKLGNEDEGADLTTKKENTTKDDEIKNHSSI
ncbi:MAG: hypothetical protein P4L34_05590 [Paludibacter sp.]|nr:hypothetical protein [Paludibacter sp.]